MSDAHADLVADLDDLARHLEVPPGVDVVTAAIARIRTATPRRSTRSWLAVAAIILIVVLLVALIAPARRAVADWLGIGGTRVTSVDALPERLGSTLDLGRAIDVGAATRAAPGPVTFPARIGAPDGAFAGRPEGGVSFVWQPSSDLPEVRELDVGLLLTTYPADLDRPTIEKLLPPETTLATVDVNGVEGFWLAGGEHVFMYLERDGEPQEDTARLAANTLLWEREGVAYRLESTLDRDAALRLARGMTGN
jgi:hypothetical protein